MVWVDLASHRDYQISGDGLDPRINSGEARFSGGLDVPLQFSKGNLVKVLKFAVLLALLLHGIVGEMHQLVLEVFQGVFLAGCAHVSLLIPVAFH